MAKDVLQWLTGANSGQYQDLGNQQGIVGSQYKNIIDTASSLQQQEQLNDAAYGSAINSMNNRLAQNKMQNIYSVYSKGQTGGLANMVMAQTNQQFATQSTDLAIQNTLKQISIDMQKQQLVDKMNYLQAPTDTES